MKQVFPKIKKHQKLETIKNSAFDKRMDIINEITNNGKCWWLHQYLIPYVRTGGCSQ